MSAVGSEPRAGSREPNHPLTADNPEQQIDSIFHVLQIK